MGETKQKPRKQLETPAELAERVGLSVSAVRHLIKEGQLEHIFPTPGKRNPKIPVGSWERYLEKSKIGAPAAKQ